MLFNEPKLLKYANALFDPQPFAGFSALQRAEIAEMPPTGSSANSNNGFSALQRAEIAEIEQARLRTTGIRKVSVLFNEPKLLKYVAQSLRKRGDVLVSVLFNEPKLLKSSSRLPWSAPQMFQCSSTSRNC